jgi:hypothetical protein
MPISNVNHTVDIIFTSGEIAEMLEEKASQLPSTQKMIFDTISVGWDDKECNHSEDNFVTVDRKSIPAFTLHFKAEGS